MRRVLIILLLLLPALVLAGWLFAEQAPILLAPQWWWISSTSPEGAPAACEAATSLNVYQGQRLLFQQPAISPEEAKASADQAIAEHYRLSDEQETGTATLEYGGPSLFSAVLNGERRFVWLYTARVATSHLAGMPGSDMPGPGAVVYVDATTGEVLALLSAVGTGSAEAMCPFPLRDWAVTTVRSTPFLALAGYLGLLLVLTIVLVVTRSIRSRPGQTPQTSSKKN